MGGASHVPVAAQSEPVPAVPEPPVPLLPLVEPPVPLPLEPPVPVLVPPVAPVPAVPSSPVGELAQPKTLSWAKSTKAPAKVERFIITSSLSS